MGKKVLGFSERTATILREIGFGCICRWRGGLRLEFKFMLLTEKTGCLLVAGGNEFRVQSSVFRVMLRIVF